MWSLKKDNFTNTTTGSYQGRSQETRWWLLVNGSFSMLLVKCSNMIWHYLKSTLNFNEQYRLRTFIDPNKRHCTKGIDVGYCSFNRTSSCRISWYGTYYYRYRQWTWTPSFIFDACLYFHFGCFLECMMTRHKSPFQAVFTAFLQVLGGFLLVFDIVWC